MSIGMKWAVLISLFILGLAWIDKAYPIGNPPDPSKTHMERHCVKWEWRYGGAGE